MKKKILLILLMLALFLPMSSFKVSAVHSGKHFKARLTGKAQFTNVYIGINDSASSPRGVFYEIYTDGTDNVVYVYDYMNATGYTAVGLTWTVTPPHGGISSQHVQFDVYSLGSIVDSYAGLLVQ